MSFLQLRQIFEAHDFFDHSDAPTRSDFYVTQNGGHSDSPCYTEWSFNGWKVWWKIFSNATMREMVDLTRFTNHNIQGKHLNAENFP